MAASVTLPVAGVFVIASLAHASAFVLNAHETARIQPQPSAAALAKGETCLRALAFEPDVSQRIDKLAILNADLTRRIEALATATPGNEQTGAGASP